MARKSAVAKAAENVISEGGLIKRLAPPDHLTPDERAIWVATVNSKPPEWFQLEHSPVLIAYVQSISTYNTIQGQLRLINPKRMQSEEGLKHYDKMRRMASQESKNINALARAMRLTHQSVYKPQQAATLAAKGKVAGGRRPWETEGEGE